jgi:hypothetical protein
MYTAAMSDGAIEGQVVARREISPITRAILLAVAALVLLALVVWSGQVRAERLRREALAQGVDALSAACAPVVIPALTSPARLRPFISSIREAGGYSLVAISDSSGKVIAATDTRLVGQTLPSLKGPPTPTKLAFVNGRLRAIRAIVLGTNNVVGGLLVEWE